MIWGLLERRDFRDFLAHFVETQRREAAALALEEGLIHSESLLADAPQSFGGYQPGNFQQSFHGPVSVSEAL